MSIPQSDKVFSGSMAEMYHSHLTPMFFDSYALRLAGMVASETVSSVLELGAGTGVVTRAMVDALDSDVAIEATDLNEPMMAFAQSVRRDTNVRWSQADACKLGHTDAHFDAVACQFAVMFFPDRVQAYAEARRVLKPGGRFVFSVWDRLSENEFAETVEQALGELFPSDPPKFMSRTPFGYYEIDEIVSDLHAAGFKGDPIVETIADRSRAPSAAFAAKAFCRGTPVQAEVESRDASQFEHANKIVQNAFSERFGEGEIEGKMQAHVFSIRV